MQKRPETRGRYEGSDAGFLGAFKAHNSSKLLDELSPEVPVQLGQHSFPTLKSAGGFVRDFLWSATPGEPIKKRDRGWVLDLLERHPNWESKSEGLVDLRVMVAQAGTRCFELVYLDGTSDDISAKKCLTYANWQAHRANSAFRWAVLPQKKEFRDEVFSAGGDVICPVTGKRLENTAESCYVDHDHNLLSFRDLVESFLLEKKLAIEDVETEGCSKGGSRLSDRVLQQEFVRYHREHAKLRLISRKAHLLLHKFLQMQ